MPVQLQRVFDDTQVGLRMEKSQAAASQVTYYNAEKWLYEMLAGASADAPAGSKIYAPRADTAGKAGAVGPAGVVGLGGGTDLGLWAGPDGVFDTRVVPQVAPVDLKTMMVADLALEQQGLPYYIDWDAVTRGPQGYDLTQIPLVKGRPEGLEPSTWRSGYLRMDEKYQEALAVARGPESLSSTANRRTRGLQPSAWGSTQISPNAKYYDAATASGYLNVGKMGTSVAAQASGLDTLRLSVLPELMETWEAGGQGSLTVSRYELMTSYRNLSRVAADSGLVVQPATPVKLENGMYQLNYQLRPILETDPAWVSAGGDPAKAMQAVSQKFMGAYFNKKKVGEAWVPAPFGQLPLGELVQKAQAWAGDVRSMLPGTAFDRAQGAVAHNAALNAGTVPYSPQLPFGPGVVTYEFGLPSTKVAAPAPGSMPLQTDILNLLEQGNDPRFVFGVFIPGTSGVTSGVNPDLVVKNQQYGKSQGFDLYSRLEQFLVDKLGPLFGTPGGTSATSPVLTRDIPHGGTLEVKGDPNYVRWPGDQEPGKPAFKSGTGIASGRGRKLGEGPQAHDAYLLGPREAITEGDAIREAENSDKFDFWGSDEEVPTDPNGAAYALGAENKETQRLQSASDTALEYGGTGKQKEGWLADEEHKLAGMEATPAPPLVPYVELPRGMSQYDGPDGLRQFYIDRITAFRDYMGKSAAELGITADEDAARTEIARQVWGSINENPIVKVARGTLEKYVDAVHMTSEVVGAAAGTNKLSGNWVWNEVEKKAEWVARQFNIPGTGLHIWPNYGGEGERGVWQLELPAGSFTVSAQPAYLPGGETMMPVFAVGEGHPERVCAAHAEGRRR